MTVKKEPQSIDRFLLKPMSTSCFAKVFEGLRVFLFRDGKKKLLVHVCLYASSREFKRRENLFLYM